MLVGGVRPSKRSEDALQRKYTFGVRVTTMRLGGHGLAKKFKRHTGRKGWPPERVNTIKVNIQNSILMAQCATLGERCPWRGKGTRGD